MERPRYATNNHIQITILVHLFFGTSMAKHAEHTRFSLCTLPRKRADVHGLLLSWALPCRCQPWTYPSTHLLATLNISLSNPKPALVTEQPRNPCTMEHSIQEAMQDCSRRQYYHKLASVGSKATRNLKCNSDAARWARRNRCRRLPETLQWDWFLLVSLQATGLLVRSVSRV